MVNNPFFSSWEVGVEVSRVCHHQENSNDSYEFYLKVKNEKMFFIIEKILILNISEEICQFHSLSPIVGSNSFAAGC